jgi:hypothetical protein
MFLGKWNDAPVHPNNSSYKKKNVPLQIMLNNKATITKVLG